MAADSISVAEALDVINVGELLQSYPEDRPFPSRLLFATVNGRALHVVVASDATNDRHVLVTVYEPDPTRWTDDFKRRKP